MIGRQLTPLLTSVGHDVSVLSKPGSDPSRAEQLGAKAVIADLPRPPATCHISSHIMW
jgi:hypothetical protein